MFPEAGGSASFARHAFNELVSFVAGWGQMLNYIITVAISAFFVPHYLGVFWEPLRTSPGDIIGGIVLIVALAAAQHQGHAGVGPAQPRARDRRPRHPGAAGDRRHDPRLQPRHLIGNVDLGVAPTWGDFALGIALGMIAYTGIETISNMSEEAIEPEKTIPRGTGLRRLGGDRPLRAAADHRAVGDAGHARRQTATRPSSARRSPAIRCSASSRTSASAPASPTRSASTSGILAAVILVIATNAGMIGVSRLTFSMGQHRQLPERLRQIHPRFRTPHVAIITFSIVASIALLPGQADLLATMYSFGAMLSFTVAHVSVLWMRRRHSGCRTQVEADGKRPGRRGRDPADGGLRRPRDVRGVDRRHGDEPGDDGDRARLDDRSARSSTWLYRRSQVYRSRRRSRSSCRSHSTSRRSSTARCSSRSRTTRSRS